MSTYTIEIAFDIPVEADSLEEAFARTDVFLRKIGMDPLRTNLFSKGVTD